MLDVKYKIMLVFTKVYFKHLGPVHVKKKTAKLENIKCNKNWSRFSRFKGV